MASSSAAVVSATSDARSGLPQTVAGGNTEHSQHQRTLSQEHPVPSNVHPVVAGQPSATIRGQSVSPSSTDTEDEGLRMRRDSQQQQQPQQGQNQPGTLTSISETEDNADETDEDLADPEEMKQIGGGMLNQMVLKSGYLLKKGERRKNWKKRFFVLRPDRLCYYKDDKEYQILRSIAVHEVHACARIEVKRHDNAFGIVTPRRTYYVRAQDERQVNDWVYKINDARSEMDLKQQASVGESGDSTPLRTQVSTPLPESSGTGVVAPANALGTSPLAAQPIATKAIPIKAARSGSAYPAGASFNTAGSSYSTAGDYNRGQDTYLSSSFASNASSSDAFEGSPPGLSARMDKIPFRTVGGDDAVAVDGSLQPRRTRKTSMPASGSDQEGGYFPALDAASSSEDEDDINVPFASQASPQMPDLPTPAAASTSAPKPPLKVAIQAADPHRIVMSGYLMKATKRKNWRKRWFTLTSHRLMYSRSHIDPKVNREISLEQILDAMEYTPPARNRTLTGQLSPMLGQGEVPMSPTSEGKRPLANCFKIITPSRTFLVCAPSEEDEIKWLSALRVLIAAKRKPLGSPIEPASGNWPSASAPATQNKELRVAPLPASGSQQMLAAATPGTGANYPSIESKLEGESIAIRPQTEAKGVPGHTRTRSATEVALGAIRDVERSFSKMAKV